MQSDLKVDKQCSEAGNEVNKRLGMINRNFKCKAKKIILPLYKSFVRPHLDYCVQAWRPHYRKDIDKLEKVQRQWRDYHRGRWGSCPEPTGYRGPKSSSKSNDNIIYYFHISI